MQRISPCAIYLEYMAYSVPVPAATHFLHLALHSLDVLQCPFLRMHPALDCGVLGRQAKGVPSDGMQYFVALHVLEPGQHIGYGVYS